VEAPLNRKQEWMTTTFELVDTRDTELIAQLRARIANDDIAVEEFNAGFEAYRNGIPLRDEPQTTQDQWRVGWGWAAFADQTEAIRQARQQLRATSENWREDCLFRADEILTKALGDDVKQTFSATNHH
jgi:hypothetical protein